MMHTVIDHLAIGAATLEDGAAWVAQRLGVAPQGGGRHPRMGTHNRLLRLGKGQYLEVIAVDPDAPPPDRPRWFGLDDPAVQARLAERPRLLGWIARTDTLAEARAAADDPDLFGPAEEMSRGSLSWRITIRPDGASPAGGALPSLIQWPEGAHPCDALPEVGCRLESLTLHHPRPEMVRETLSRILFVAGPVAVTVTPAETTPAAVAVVRGRRGLVTFD